jgi:hypothetical protein
VGETAGRAGAAYDADPDADADADADKVDDPRTLV